MFKAALIASTLIVALPSKAHACLSTFMLDAVFFDEAPDNVLDGDSVFLVRATGKPTREFNVEVTIEQSSDSVHVGKSLRLSPEFFSSCTTWGRLDGPAYVVGTIKASESGGEVLRARLYQRGDWDRIVDQVGVRRFTASGEPVNYDID